MIEDEHVMITETNGDGTFRASCACGWRHHRKSDSHGGAEAEFVVHVRLRQYWLNEARKRGRAR